LVLGRLGVERGRSAPGTPETEAEPLHLERAIVRC